MGYRLFVKFSVLVIFIGGGIVSPALAWGPEGHEIVARIAAAELSPAARHGVESLIGTPAADRMAAVSNWADRIKRERPETAPWHYVDIEIGNTGYVAERDCPRGDCVVAEIGRARDTLADPAAPRQARIEALEFLIHFVGDIHQPLHCADARDRGGNDVPVIDGYRRTNLHAVWDRLPAVAFEGMGDARAAAMLDARITPTERRAWRRGDAASWANESFGIARDDIYGRLPRGESLPAQLVGAPFADRALMETQLEKAGVRLAQTLNAIWQWNRKR